MISDRRRSGERDVSTMHTDECQVHGIGLTALK